MLHFNQLNYDFSTFNPKTIHAIQIAYEAGELLRARVMKQRQGTHDNYFDVHTKLIYDGPISDDDFNHSYARINSFATAADAEVDAYVKNSIKRLYPDDKILSEENNEIVDIDYSRDQFWVVDPVDGTTNILNLSDDFCVILSYCNDGEIQSGVTYAPMYNQLYYAEKDKGAYLNGEPWHGPNQRRDMQRTHFIQDASVPWDHYMAVVKTATSYGASPRGPYACGGLDILRGTFTGCGYPRKLWDAGAGILIRQEAGDLATDMYGNPLKLTAADETEFVVANRYLHPTACKIMQEAMASIKPQHILYQSNKPPNPI